MEFSWRRRTPSATATVSFEEVKGSPSDSVSASLSPSPSPSPKSHKKSKWNIRRLPHSMHYYALLGLTDNPLCSQEEIRRAYHRQALRLHPDKNPGKEADFKHLLEAYSTLGDRGRRRLYDKYGIIAINLLDSFGASTTSNTTTTTCSSSSSNTTTTTSKGNSLELLIGFLLNTKGMKLTYITISLVILGAISTPLISAWRLCFFPEAEATTKIKMLPWSLIVGLPLQTFYFTFLVVASIALHLSWKLKASNDDASDDEITFKMQERRRKERLLPSSSSSLSIGGDEKGFLSNGGVGGVVDDDHSYLSSPQPSPGDLQRFALFVAVVLLYVGVGSLSFQTALLTLKLDSFIFLGSCSWFLILGPYLVFESVIISWNIISAIMYCNDSQFWYGLGVDANEKNTTSAEAARGDGAGDGFSGWKKEYAPLRGMLFVRPYFVYKKIRAPLLRGYMSTTFCLLISGKLSSLWFLFAPLYAIFPISILLDRLVLGRKRMFASSTISSLPFRVSALMKMVIIVQISLLHLKAVRMSHGKTGPTWFWSLSPFLVSQIVLIGGMVGMGILGYFFIPDLRKNNPFAAGGGAGNSYHPHPFHTSNTASVPSPPTRAIDDSIHSPAETLSRK